MLQFATVRKADYAALSSDGGPPQAERSYETNPTSDCLTDLPQERLSISSSKMQANLQCQVELATFLANISRSASIVKRIMQSAGELQMSAISDVVVALKDFLNRWATCRSFHLNLMARKIQLNFKATQEPKQPVYHMDVFRLDRNM
ncbi:hypothetical protein Ciccas_005763 [Cichlidogyrus casuarinus]|uniref:Uncharacterized protein n=1 Tax=Cichlidogyrus casuarinus TaxID=1844966 RepID=A0ABD2Q7Q6_9PLAT